MPPWLIGNVFLIPGVISPPEVYVTAEIDSKSIYIVPGVAKLSFGLGGKVIFISFPPIVAIVVSVFHVNVVLFAAATTCQVASPRKNL